MSPDDVAFGLIFVILAIIALNFASAMDETLLQEEREE